MRIAVIGANGQLGHDLVRVGTEMDDIEIIPYQRPEVDVTRPNTLTKAFKRDQPEVVINTAAWTDVDGCEGDPEKAFQVNAVGALHVARAASTVGGRTVFISTDYVFDGDKPPPEDGKVTPETGYTEEDTPNPINVYGASKLAGEQMTRIGSEREPLVCRISGVFGVAGARGKDGANFIETMLAMADKHPELKGVSDQWITPTWTYAASQAILEVAGMEDVTGTIHVTSPDACTWYELAEAALRAAGYENPIKEVGRDAFPAKAERPVNGAMNTDRLRKVSRKPSMGWREMVEGYVAGNRRA